MPRCLVGLLMLGMAFLPMTAHGQRIEGAACGLSGALPKWMQRAPSTGPLRYQARARAEADSLKKACDAVKANGVRALCLADSMIVALTERGAPEPVNVNCPSQPMNGASGRALLRFRDDAYYVEHNAASGTYLAHVLVSAKRADAPGALELAALSALFPGGGSFRRGEKWQGIAVLAAVAVSGGFAYFFDSKQNEALVNKGQALEVERIDYFAGQAAKYGRSRGRFVVSAVGVWALGVALAGRSAE